eukprot:6181071-Pyramimonas_sp.AAC.1
MHLPGMTPLGSCGAIGRSLIGTGANKAVVLVSRCKKRSDINLCDVTSREPSASNPDAHDKGHKAYTEQHDNLCRGELR